MESGRSRRVEKRGYEQSIEGEDDDGMVGSKKSKLPAMASVIMEALKLDGLQKLCSSMEPLLRRIVSEEIERALSKLGPAKVAGRSLSPRIQFPEGKNLHLQFRTKMPPHLFTGGKVEGEKGAAIHVVLLDVNTGSVVQAGLESIAKLNVVVLEGDFNEEDDDNWTKEHFENHEVKEREGKRPLLTGDLHVILKEGIGTLGDLTFTDNSSWIRSRKFRLAVKVAPGCCEEIRVREGRTEAFAVKDHRGELYKKHYPPALHDEVWRLDRIAKDGALHKKLMKAEIVTVEHFLRLFVREPQRLRSILGSGMSNRMWENTVEHAKTCVLDGKLYVYCTDATQSTGVVFNHIYELKGLIADGQILPLESLTHNQKISVDSLVKRAYENWNHVVEYDGKVLHSIYNNPKGTATSTSAADHNDIIDHHFSTTQNRQLYMSSEPSSQYQTGNNHPMVPQLIEYPFFRPDPLAGMALTTPQSYTPVEWFSRPRNGQGLEDDFFSEDIRMRSSEMLESDDMQRLLKTFSTGAGGHSNEAFYSQNTVPYEPQVNQMYGHEHGRSSGKAAVVGWLKLKAALRWGIFIRKRAAERRAQLVELD